MRLSGPLLAGPPKRQVTLTRRYFNFLVVGALVLFALSLAESYLEWRLAPWNESLVPWDENGGGFWRVLEWTLFSACGTITLAAPYILGLTFAVGLVAAFREPGPLALAPSVLMSVVGTLVTLASTADLRKYANMGDTSPEFIFERAVWAVVPLLTASLILSTALFVVVVLRARRAS